MVGTSTRHFRTMLSAALLALSLRAVVAVQEPAPTPTAPPPAAEPVAAAPEELAAVASLCERIEASITRGALDELVTAIDYAQLLERAFVGLDIDERFVANSLAQMTGEQAPWTEIVAANRDADGSFHFMRVLPTLPLRALFRNTNDLGLNYYEFEFARDVGNELRIVDFYSYGTAVRAQSRIRDFGLPLHRHLESGRRARLVGRDGAMVRALGRIKRIREKQSEDPAAALELFDSLSVEIRYEPSFMLWRIQLALPVNLEEYSATIDDFVKRHPDSRALPLVLLDHHSLRKEWDATLAALDRLDRDVGGDPYLDIMRAGILRAAERFDEAVVCAERAAAADPRIAREALWDIVKVGLARDDHEAVYATLVRIDDLGDRGWHDMSQNTAYAEFVKSPQYERWLRYLDSKSKR